LKTVFSFITRINKSEPLFKFLFQVFIFLLPTQLGLHFWPAYSHIFGVRIDYLSPTLFLTDILFIVLLVLWFIQNIKRIDIFRNSRLKGRSATFLIAILVFISINIFSALSPALSLLRWLKIIEIGLFIWLVSREKEEIKKWLITPLSLAVIFYSLIGIYQFIVGSTLGRAAYWLGERSFNISTPGIAIVSFLGQIHLRAYATFSHPNSLAGFLLVSLILVLFSKTKDLFSTRLKYLALFIGGICFLFTFSLASLVTIPLIILLGIVLSRKEKQGSFIIQTLFMVLIVSGLILPVISDKLLSTGRQYSLSVRDRLILASTSGYEIIKSPIFGVGMNNFITNLPSVSKLSRTTLINQPVHNIFLLVFSEAGIVGLFVFAFLIYKFLMNNIQANNLALTLCLLAILITGFIDHYWLTLQQNMFLFGLILGLSSNNKNK
jgi:O-antigen ligase